MSSTPEDFSSTRNPKVPDATVSETRLFSINTQNIPSNALRNGSMKSDLYVNLPGLIMMHGEAAFVTMKVQSMAIPNVFYNIPTDDVFWLNYAVAGGVAWSTQFVVPAGFYDVNTLCDTLNLVFPDTAVNGVVLRGKIIFSYNPITAKIQVAVNDSNNSEILIQKTSTFSRLGFPAVPPSDVKQFSSNGQSLSCIDLQTTLSGSTYVAYTMATFMPSLSGVTNIIIQSPQIPTLNYSTELESSFIVNVPLVGDFGFVSQYQFYDAAAFLIPANILVDVLELFVYDQRGQLVDFQNNDWSMIFEVNYFRTSVPQFESMTDALRRLIAESMQIAQEQEAEGGPRKKKTKFEEVQMLELNSSGVQYLLETK
jgi:hypothetical protein